MVKRYAKATILMVILSGCNCLLAEESTVEVDRPDLVLNDYLRTIIPGYKTLGSIAAISQLLYESVVTGEAISPETEGLEMALSLVTVVAVGVAGGIQLWHVYITRDEKQTRLWRQIGAIEDFVLAGAALGLAIWGFVLGGEAVLLGAGMAALSWILAAMGVLELMPYPFETKSPS